MAGGVPMGPPPEFGPGGWPPPGPPGAGFGPPGIGMVPPPPDGGPPMDDGRPHRHGILALVDKAGAFVAGFPGVMAHPSRRPIVVGGQEVGALLFDTGTLPDGIEGAFLAQRAHDITLAAGLALVLSALWAVLLARHILEPVHIVIGGARLLASGNFATRLDAGRSDELGDLLRDFNQLAAALETAEQARRNWVADTSHELRTPLAVLRAQIEALQDGVHEAGPASLARLHGEVLGMTRLVDDLHELARADGQALGLRLEAACPAEIMAEVLDRLAARREAAGLALDDAGLVPPGAAVMADPDRLRQVFGNLIENAIRYTNAGGAIRVSAASTQDAVSILVEDSAPSVPDAKMPRLFERFFRVDSSRNRKTGGSGLGLAISRAIVEAHAGTISAAASALGGLAVTVTLPTARATT